jgi:hypothetical protein
VIADDRLSRGNESRWLMEGLPGFTQQVQPGAYLEAEFQEPIARDNRAIVFALVVECGFESADECFSFVANLPKNCPGEGVLELGIVDGARVRYDAVVQSVVPSNASQLAVTLTYNIMAKPQTATAR